MKINTTILSLLLALPLCWTACKSDNNQKNDQAQSEEALEALEIAQGGGVASSAQNAFTQAANEEAAKPSTASEPHINGSNVIMRKDASVKSDKLSTFNPNEAVTVLETKNVNNENEAILTQSIPLYTNENQSGAIAMTLPKGKAVVIEQYNADDNKYEVSYQVEGKGKLFAKISADAVETISYSTWYRVKKASGEEGWVLGKFLKMN